MGHVWSELDFVAGPAALDFANTASWSEDGSLTRERLASYEVAIDWAVKAKLFDDGVAQDLRALSEKNVREAELALGRLRRFRQDLVDVIVPVTAGSRAAPEAQDDLARWFRDAQANALLRLG